MVNFGPRDSVPEKFRSRKFVIHNPNVTLMRTTRDENRAFGEWIGARLNAMNGPVRFLLPEGGVSMLDAPGQPFHDPEADNALFEAIEKTVRQHAAAPGRARAGQHQRHAFRRRGRRRVPRDHAEAAEAGMKNWTSPPCGWML